MRKLLTRLLVFLLAVTSVFGLTGLKSVKADNVAVEGIEIIGASVRNNNANENDLTGIRFTTTVSQEAYDAIIAEAGESEVQFGTEITDNDAGLKIQDFCYVSTVAGGEGITQVVNGAFEYYASITFNDVDFAKDVLKKLRSLGETDEVDLATATAEETAKINAYKALAYAELLKATSYYKIDGTKYYTKSLVRSMRMVANYYDKNQEEFGKLPEEFYAKNYFVAGVERFGYLKENGEVVADNVKVDAITGVSYKAQPVEFEVVDAALKVKDTAFVEEELSETLALYAFDKDNRVTVLNLKYVTDTISTKEDLSKFEVDYTYSQEKFESFETVAEKVKYLEYCQANPYNYYEGYYVLTNDIDADGWKEVHNAVFATPTSGNIGFTIDETNNKYVPVNTNATITYEGVDYNFPRPGYPVRSSASGTPNYSYFSKVGFRGIFDGQGYTISNLSFAGRGGSATNGRYTYYTDDTLNYATSTSCMGAGIFGAITSPAQIKNVAIDNAYVDFGAVFAMVLHAPGSAAWTAPDIYQQVRIQFENVYVRTRNAREWGIITYKLSAIGPTYVNCFFDFTTIGSGGNNDFKGTTILGHGQVSQANTGLQSRAVNMYMVVRNKKLNGGDAEHGMSGAKSNANFDITLAESLDELYNATTNIHGVEETMAQAFADNPYFTVVGNKVYWRGVYEKSLALNKTSVELAKGETEEITLSVGGETVTPEKVEYNEEVLKYAGTTLSINNYVAGTYEVVFTYNGAKTVLTVTLPAIVKKAYLQVDGELVSHGIDSIVGKYFTVNDTEVEATMYNGKIKLDIASLNLTAPTTKALSATVEMYGDYGKEITFNCEYVTLAIDEGEDLKHFNVGYTFDEAEYNALSSDVARHEYLAKCQANPFDYYEGYFILVKDVDASGVVFNHEAVIAPTITDAGFTYATAASATAPTVTALTGAITIPAAGDYAETTYNVPRAGYPVTNGLMNNAFDVKVGFNGIFEGNGHIITNLNDTARPVIKYVKADGSYANAYDVGAGLFGVLKPKAQIQNVAFVNVNVSKSGGLAMYAAARSGWKSISDVAPSGKRPTLQNVFIKTAPSAVNYGVVASKNDGVSSMRMRFVVIDATSHTSLAPSESKLTGGINGGERSSNNGGLNADARYTYISASAHELYYGYGNTADSKVWNRKAGTAPATAPSTYVKADFPLNYKDLNASIDWAGTVDTADDISMYKAFTESITENSWTDPYNFSEYWEVINGMVFFKGTYGYYATPTVESVEITDAEQKVEVGLKDIDDNAITEGVEVKVNGDAIEYVGGKVQVKNYIAGEYELTFIYKGAEIVVPVVLAPQQKTAYLQTNGELVGSGLETIDGKSFKVNDTAVDATIVDGKIMLDIAKLGLTAPVYTAGTAEVELLGAYGTEIVYTSMYVAVAIDEASDLQQFGVNYTYNQAEFDAMPETTEEEIAAKVAYLEDKLVNPYTYFEGYVVLTKDIDADGITFHHDAIYSVALKVDNIGYTINEVGNSLTAKNTNATITFNNKDYDFPRPGYPAFKGVSSASKDYDYIPGAFFYKMGFYGTFDGQGHVIDNLNPVNTADIEYYVGETATEYKGYGAGIFGAVSANDVFKNVALTNYVGKTGPAFAFVDITPTSKGTASYNYDEKDVFNAMGKSNRTVFTNMYIEVVGNDNVPGSTVRYNAGNRGSNFDNIIVNALNGGWGNGVYGSGREAGYLGGGYQWSNKNGSLCQQVDNVVIIAPEGQNPAYTDATYTHLDVIFEHSPEAAFSATTNTIGETVATPLERFNGVEYFTVVGNQVYWHSLAPSAE